MEKRAARAARARDAAVDASARRTHGVVHTPPALCRYVVERADAALRRAGVEGGLADPRVTLVDPACGPGGFLAAALGLAGARESAPAACRGLERDPAALAEAAEVLGEAFEEAGWPLSLEPGDTLASLEGTSAEDVLVVFGNPPWAGRSGSKTALLEGLLEDFRRDAHGARLTERKLGVLSDAYVRFWRWAAEGVRRAPGGGVVALVTNASFLDGPVHRGMRGALARWMDGVEVLDLGGSALVAQKKGERDENVFGVRPAVAVTVAWRAGGGEAGEAEGATDAAANGAADPGAEEGRAGSVGGAGGGRDAEDAAQATLALGAESSAPGPRVATAEPAAEEEPPPEPSTAEGEGAGAGANAALAEVRVMALRGRRDAKLRALGHALSAFRAVDPLGPWRLPPSLGVTESWPEGWRPIDALFPFHREGVQTNRDAVAIDASRHALVGRLQTFAMGLADPRLEVARTERGHYDPEKARRVVAEALAEDPDGGTIVRPIAYRPFDRRWLAAAAPLCHRPRPALLKAMDASEFALLTVRKDRGERAWTHAAASRAVPDNCFLSARSSCRTRAFPTHDPGGAPNLSEEAEGWLRGVGRGDAADLLAYALAVLCSPVYRGRYGWLLRFGYPVLPAPEPASWPSVVEAGRALVERFLAEPAGDPELAVVGHWEVEAPAGFGAAVAAAAAAVAPLLEG